MKTIVTDLDSFIKGEGPCMMFAGHLPLLKDDDVYFWVEKEVLTRPDIGPVFYSLDHLSKDGATATIFLPPRAIASDRSRALWAIKNRNDLVGHRYFKVTEWRTEWRTE